MSHEQNEIFHDVAETALELAPHIGVEIAKDLLHVLCENPVPFLDTILALVKMVFEKIHQAHFNKAQLKRIGDCVVVVSPFIERLKKTKCQESIILAVNEFGGCLKACIAQADKYSQENFFKRFLFSGTDKEKFEQLMFRLNRAVAHLDLGLSIEIARLVEKLQGDEEQDKKQDKEVILKNMAEIMRLAEISLREIQGARKEQKIIRMEQSEQHELMGLQLQSISLEIANQLKLTEMQRGELFAEQFKLLHQRFNRLEVSPAKIKPPIPRKLSIHFQNISFERVLIRAESGTVYAGSWSYIPVNVKRIGKNLLPTDYEKFIRELKIMAKLRHPNVVLLYGACLEPEACLVTEYMENNSLRDYIEALSSKYDIDKKIALALDIAKGLVYLHQCDVLHRDLRPENILINQHGVAKLSDFGLSKTLDEKVGTIQERSTDTVWLAPEVLSLQAVHTQASEVYTYGMILWFLFTQKRPFQDIASEKLVEYIKQGHQEKISADIPEEIALLIKQCWSLEPTDRPSVDIIIEKLLKFDPLKQLTPRTLCKFGQKYEAEGENKKAFSAYLRSANGGFFGGQANLATCLIKGIGCEKNPEESFRWMLSAAKEGNYPRAQFNVAKMYERGEGVAQDIDEAKKWYEKAEAQGITKATESLINLRTLKK